MEVAMPPSRKRLPTLLGLLLAGLSFAPAANWQAPPNLSPLATARYKAALKQFDETWSYYQQSRIDSYQVYVWSRLVLDCQLDQAQNKAERVAALEGHLARMKKLQALITKVRRIGFSRSYDVGAAEYYRLEVDYWLAREKARK
jgi:hypothetical protein